MIRRVALAVSDESMQAWEATCVEALVREGCEIAGRIVCGGLGTQAQFSRAPSSQRLVGLPEPVRASPVVGDPTDARLGAVDVTLAFDERIGEHARAASAQETWTFVFGSADRCGWPIACRELMRGAGAIEAALARVGASPRVALERGWFPTTPHSYAETVDAARFGAAAFPAHAVREQSRGCPARAIPLDPPAGNPQPFGAAARATLSARLVCRAAGLRLHYLFAHEHWNIAVVDRPIESFLDRPGSDDAQWLQRPPLGSFVADPFGRVADGVTYLLCEGFEHRDGKGYLASGPIVDGRARLEPFLRLPVHLSYPFVVEDGADVYCVPEMSQADEIALFRARAFPREWERAATLVTGFGGCDPSVVNHGGRWWLFCTGRYAPNHELYAWHAERLMGPWREHGRNPIKSDVRSSRPAGTPFVRDGVLYRPAQDCAGSYGRRVVVNRVKTLTPTDFEEEPAAYVEPDPSGPCRAGLHTLSSAGAMTLIDGKFYRFVPAEFAATALSYVAKAARAASAPFTWAR